MTIIAALEAIVIVVFLIAIFKQLYDRATSDTRMSGLMEELQTQTKKNAVLRSKVEQSIISQKNTHHVIELVNKLTSASLFNQRYIQIYQQVLADENNNSQYIYLVFYEDEYIYTQTFLRTRPEYFDIFKDVSEFKLKCTVCADGDSFEPLGPITITPDTTAIPIDGLKINSRHDGKGIGSLFVIKLVDELSKYRHFKTIYGRLSYTDYPAKDKLVSFFKKCNFDEITPMTESADGQVIKYIRNI